FADRRLAGAGRAPAAARPDRRRYPAALRLPARLASGRPGDLGQSGDHAPRPPLRRRAPPPRVAPRDHPRRPVRFIAQLLLGMLAAGACAAAGLDDYKEQMLPVVAKTEAGKKNLTVMFTGVATLLFDDGETAIMTDGFFTRIPQNALRSIRPDRDAIARSL